MHIIHVCINEVIILQWEAKTKFKQLISYSNTPLPRQWMPRHRNTATFQHLHSFPMLVGRGYLKLTLLLGPQILAKASYLNHEITRGIFSAFCFHMRCMSVMLYITQKDVIFIWGGFENQRESTMHANNYLTIDLTVFICRWVSDCQIKVNLLLSCTEVVSPNKKRFSLGSIPHKPSPVTKMTMQSP